MGHRQFVSLRSIYNRKYLKKLKIQLNLANQCLLAKNKIIESLRVDLDHLIKVIAHNKQERSN
jgi:hypothetical protein